MESLIKALSDLTVLYIYIYTLHIVKLPVNFVIIITYDV